MPIRVLAAVVEQDGKFLICQRPAHKRHGGLWEFPGGKMEPGESEFEAAVRELDEELGVSVVSVGKRHLAVNDPGSEFVIEFFPVTIRGDAEAREHTEVRWLTLDALHSLDLAPSDRRFVESLGKTGNRTE